MDVACLTPSPCKKAFIDLTMNQGSQSEMTLSGIPNLWKRLSIRSVVIPSEVTSFIVGISIIPVMINLIVFRCSTYGLLLHFTLLHISNGLVSVSLVGHVLYSADLMSAICSPYYYLMVHRYIYSRYFSVFLMLYQLYHSLPSSTLNPSSSLYLSVAT